MNNFNSGMGNINNMYPKTASSTYFNPGSATYGNTTPTNNIIWVQGIEGAKAWQLNPNSMAILLDSEVEGKMYIKVSDNIGMSSLRVFNYVEELNKPSTNVSINQDLDLSSYVRKDELALAIKEAIEQYEQSLQVVAKSSGESTSKPNTTATNAKSVTILSK